MFRLNQELSESNLSLFFFSPHKRFTPARPSTLFSTFHFHFSMWRPFQFSFLFMAQNCLQFQQLTTQKISYLNHINMNIVELPTSYCKMTLNYQFNYTRFTLSANISDRFLSTWLLLVVFNHKSPPPANYHVSSQSLKNVAKKQKPKSSYLVFQLSKSFSTV